MLKTNKSTDIPVRLLISSGWSLLKVTVDIFYWFTAQKQNDQKYLPILANAKVCVDIFLDICKRTILCNTHGTLWWGLSLDRSTYKIWMSDISIHLSTCIQYPFRVKYTKRIEWSQFFPSTSEVIPKAWWRHQMETFSALLALCTENSPVPGEFPSLRPLTWSFNVFFDLRMNKRSVNNRQVVIWDAIAFIMTSL